MKKLLSVLLAVVMLCTAASCYAASAATTESHVLNVISESNFFPTVKNTYYDISQLEDENGDIFLTFEYKLNAPQMYVINVDIDELVWDSNVLEWKREYNLYGTGRNARVNMFPFVVEPGLGAGVINQTSDSRIVGNFSAVQPAVYAYNEDGTPVTLVKAVFKLLDKNAKTVTVRCNMDTVSYCDEDEEEPEARYIAVSGCDIGDSYDMGSYSSFISPGEQAMVGDADGNGKVNISDATAIQRHLAEFDDATYDLSDKKMLTTLDANYDGRVNVKDVAAVQRYAAEMVPIL